MQSLHGGTVSRLGLREAQAVYRDERSRARWRMTSTLLRQERAWREGDQPTDAQQVRLKAVRDELRERGVVLPSRRNPW